MKYSIVTLIYIYIVRRYSLPRPNRLSQAPLARPHAITHVCTPLTHVRTPPVRPTIVPRWLGPTRPVRLGPARRTDRTTRSVSQLGPVAQS
jgi:hypothetical protein